MSPGLREADECKTRLAMQMIDAGIGMSERFQLLSFFKWYSDFLQSSFLTDFEAIHRQSVQEQMRHGNRVSPTLSCLDAAELESEFEGEAIFHSKVRSLSFGQSRCRNLVS